MDETANAVENARKILEAKQPIEALETILVPLKEVKTTTEEALDMFARCVQSVAESWSLAPAPGCDEVLLHVPPDAWPPNSILHHSRLGFLLGTLSMKLAHGKADMSVMTLVKAIMQRYQYE